VLPQMSTLRPAAEVSGPFDRSRPGPLNPPSPMLSRSRALPAGFIAPCLPISAPEDDDSVVVAEDRLHQCWHFSAIRGAGDRPAQPAVSVSIVHEAMASRLRRLPSPAILRIENDGRPEAFAASSRRSSSTAAAAARCMTAACDVRQCRIFPRRLGVPRLLARPMPGWGG
jgi:hypothetical protein